MIFLLLDKKNQSSKIRATIKNAITARKNPNATLPRSTLCSRMACLKNSRATNPNCMTIDPIEKTARPAKIKNFHSPAGWYVVRESRRGNTVPGRRSPLRKTEKCELFRHFPFGFHPRQRFKILCPGLDVAFGQKPAKHIFTRACRIFFLGFQSRHEEFSSTPGTP